MWDTNIVLRFFFGIQSILASLPIQLRKELEQLVSNEKVFVS